MGYDVNDVFGPGEDERKTRRPIADDDFGERIRSLEVVPSYTLNREQQEAFDWLFKFCIGMVAGCRKALLQGYAGTGKTFTLTKMIEAVKLKFPHINFGVTAPTHKAVRVLKKQSELRDQLDFGTIHSFLGLKQKVNDLTGEVTYEPDFRPNGQPRRIDGVHILIVDEASMLDDAEYNHIETELRSNPKLRVIFTGDALQIPPVGKKQKVLHEVNAIPFVPARQVAHNIHVLSLVQPQRQSADSPIIMYAHAIRQSYTHQYPAFEFKDEYKHALEVVPIKGNKDGINQLLESYFCTPDFDEDPDYCKVVAWRNTTVRFFNNMIRELIHGTPDVGHLPKLLIGDKLVMEKPWVVKERVVLPNNEDVELVKVEVKEIEFRYTLIEKSTFTDSSVYDPFSDAEKHKQTVPLKVYQVTIANPDGDEFTGNVIHEDAEEQFKAIKAKIERAAKSLSGFERSSMWKEFYRVDDRFMWVTHNYCVTAHKSQGSTYQHTLSMEWDMVMNRDIEERNRIKYVAGTRARNKLYIVR